MPMQRSKSLMRELLDVVAVGHGVVAQDVAVVPELLDDGGGVHLFFVRYAWSGRLGTSGKRHSSRPSRTNAVRKRVCSLSGSRVTSAAISLVDSQRPWHSARINSRIRGAGSLLLPRAGSAMGIRPARCSDRTGAEIFGGFGTDWGESRSIWGEFPADWGESAPVWRESPAPSTPSPSR